MFIIILTVVIAGWQYGDIPERINIVFANKKCNYDNIDRFIIKLDDYSQDIFGISTICSKLHNIRNYKIRDMCITDVTHEHSSDSINIIYCKNNNINVVRTIILPTLIKHYAIIKTIIRDNTLFVESNYYYNIEYDCVVHNIAKILNSNLEITSVLLNDNTILGIFEYSKQFNLSDINKFNNVFVQFYNNTHIGIRYYKNEFDLFI